MKNLVCCFLIYVVAIFNVELVLAETTTKSNQSVYTDARGSKTNIGQQNTVKFGLDEEIIDVFSYKANQQAKLVDALLESVNTFTTNKQLTSELVETLQNIKTILDSVRSSEIRVSKFSDDMLSNIRNMEKQYKDIRTLKTIHPELLETTDQLSDLIYVKGIVLMDFATDYLEAKINIERKTQNTGLIGKLSIDKRKDIETYISNAGEFLHEGKLRAVISEKIVATIKAVRPDIPDNVLNMVFEEINSVISENKSKAVESLVFIYHSFFIHAEIKELNAFYDTSIGKKLKKVRPDIVQAGMLFGMKFGNDLIPEAQKRIKQKLKLQGIELEI